MISEQVIFKKTNLANAIINEINFKNKIIEEGYADIFNYGVSTRAVDLQFGGKEKLEEYVKQELLKKYKHTDISKLDPKEIQKEINSKINSAANKLASKEFIDGIKSLLVSGLINGIINSVYNALIALTLSLNIKEAISALLRGFVTGVLVEFLFKAISIVYNEFKKRILKNPYAKPTPGEIIVLSLLTITTFTTGLGLLYGDSATSIATMIALNIFASLLITALLNMTSLGKYIYYKINNFLPKTAAS